jgi:hypothetical protein
MAPDVEFPKKPLILLAYFLPLAELLICLTLAVVAIPNLKEQIKTSIHPVVQTSPSDEPRHKMPTIGKDQKWQVSIFDLLSMVNIPGIWAEFALSTHTWPYSWFPIGFADLDSWRTILWPFSALPFWFCGGLGIDYFLYRSQYQRKIRWYEFSVALLLTIFGALVLLAGFIDDHSDVRPTASDHAFGFAGAIWLLLGATCCTAWTRQRRTRRKRATNTFS